MGAEHGGQRQVLSMTGRSASAQGHCFVCHLCQIQYDFAVILPRSYGVFSRLQTGISRSEQEFRTCGNQILEMVSSDP